MIIIESFKGNCLSRNRKPEKSQKAKTQNSRPIQSKDIFLKNNFKRNISKMMSITLSNYIRVLKMIHSKQSRRKREKKKRNLELRIKALEKLAKRQLNNVHEISLSFVSLGDLRARWKSHRYKLDAKLLTKVSSFRKIKIERDESLCIRGWDNGLLVYGLHVNESLLVEDLYESIQALPEPKHYVYRGEKRSDYMTSHLCVWAKYSSKPFLSREYLDHKHKQL